MSTSIDMAGAHRDAPEAAGPWRPLHRMGAVAALVSAVLIPIQIATVAAWPPPFGEPAADWFDYVQRRPLAGLVNLDLLLVADNILLVVLVLALATVLWRTSASVTVVSVAAVGLSVAMYVATNPALQMLALSDRYAAATTGAERTVAEAAGEATLANWQGTAFHTAYLLGSAAGIALGVLLVRSGLFGRMIGWLAIVANAVGLGLYLPGVGIYVAIFSVLFLEIWYVLLARRLFRISRRRT
ncbi:MAG: hypothetical protein HOV79_10145 [Hamadaea sp.]|nr:hypothetical protein [Hamadaea sp.]